MDDVLLARSQRWGTLIRQDTVPGEEIEEYLEAVNRLSRLPLRAEQVYIRSMYLCSDRLCQQDWGQFSLEALHQICKLVIGQSVIVGHDRSRLPIARFFRAEVVRRPDDLVDEEGRPVHWVRAWFYWLRETSGARDLALNIDGGIYREVSVSWRYRQALCSICGQSIQGCPHVPGRLYEGQRCTFLIQDVAEVLEGSIVYKGAEPRAGFVGTHGKSLEEIPSPSNTAADSSAVASEAERSLSTLVVRGQMPCSIAILTDRPASIQSLLWATKRAGVRVRVFVLGQSDGLGMGGVDLTRGEDVPEAADTWELLWEIVHDASLMGRESEAWQALRQRAGQVSRARVLWFGEE